MGGVCTEGHIWKKIFFPGLGFRSHWRRCGCSPLGDGEVDQRSMAELVGSHWAAGIHPLGRGEPRLMAGHRESGHHDEHETWGVVMRA